MKLFDLTTHRLFRRSLPAYILAFLFSSSLCGANTYYVSATGNDNNSGSQTAPFRQIRAALTHLKPGDTAMVGDGSYLGFDVRSMAGNSNAPITIQASGSNCVVTTTTDRADNRDTIFVTSSSYIVLEGLDSYSANRAAVRIDNSKNITVLNGIYGNNTWWGIFTDFSDNLLLEGNECYGSQNQHGIYVSNTCANAVVRGNRLHDNHGSGLHMNGDVSQGGAGVITSALVEDNIIYGNSVAGGAGINMDGVQYSIIRNNLIYNNHAAGITSYQIDASAGPVGNQILNNTIDVPAGARWALFITNTTGLNTVRNNIFYNRDSYHGGLDYGATADVNNVDSDNNIMDRVTTGDGATVYTLAQWKATGHETHSLSATPATLWVNPGVGDYHLLPAAPAIDAGQTLAAVPDDLDGNPRPMGAASDIGCYEWQGGVPVVSLSSVSVAPSSVVGGNSATGTVSLSGVAPTGGVSVTLASNNVAAIVPSSVTVAAGATSANFSITTKAVTANTTVTLSAVYNSVTKTANLTVQAPAAVSLSSVSVSPSSVVGGNSATGTVSLSGPAPTGGVAVSLMSNNVVAVIPSSVTVAAGSSTATFSITTKAVTANTTITLSATIGSVTKTANLTVQPVAVSSTFVLGVALDGPAVTIEGNRWLSYASALTSGLSVSNAQTGQTSSVPLTPAPDANTATMLRDGIWTPGTANGVGFTLKQTLPNGNYQVYLWEVEDDTNSARNMNVLLQGVTVASGIGNQALGHWSKYGPYAAAVTNGVLTLSVVRGTKGDPQLMGLAIFKP